jgi:hypothetical protein
LARWIGIAHRVGQAMCYWLLPQSGIPIARTTIQPLTQEEMNLDNIMKELSNFDTGITERLSAIQDECSHIKLYKEDEELEEDEPEDSLIEPESRYPDVDTIEADAYDELLLAEPLLISERILSRVKIIGRKCDENGGTFHKNPLLITRVYLAEFPNGHTAEFSANVISEAIYNQVNDDGIEELCFSEIIGHERDNTALNSEEFVSQEAEQDDMTIRYTTKGWRICVTWTDGSTSWHSLADIKNSYPIQLAEYALANNLQNEPAFRWWIKPTLK